MTSIISKLEESGLWSQQGFWDVARCGNVIMFFCIMVVHEHSTFIAGSGHGEGRNHREFARYTWTCVMIDAVHYVTYIYIYIYLYTYAHALVVMPRRVSIQLIHAPFTQKRVQIPGISGRKPGRDCFEAWRANQQNLMQCRGLPVEAGGSGAKE